MSTSRVRKTTGSEQALAANDSAKPPWHVQCTHAVVDGIHRSGPLYLLLVALLVLGIIAFKCPENKWPDLSRIPENSTIAWISAGILLFGVLALSIANWVMVKTSNSRIDQLADRLREYEENDPRMKGRPTSNKRKKPGK